MSQNSDPEVRVNIVIDREDNNKLNKLLPWGTKSEVLRKIITRIIEKLEDDEDSTFCGALLQGKFDIVKRIE